MSYVPLHLHTEYSLLDGAIKIKKLCEFCKEQGWPAVAVTDHGVMHGAIELYKTAKEMGINRNIEVIEKLKDIRTELQAIGKDLGGLV